MNAKSILEEIAPQGREGYKKILLNHGAREPCLGVTIQVLKKIQKRVGTDRGLALELFDTGVYDAMYLAGLVADDPAMSKTDLERWVKMAYGPLSTSTVPWVASGSRHGWALALKWIDSPKETVAASGWATLASLASVTEDGDLDLPEFKRLLHRILRTIHTSPNGVRSEMNACVIAVGSHVASLTDFAKVTGAKIGPVTVDMGNTACEVSYSPDAIEKVERRGAIGKKRKTAKC